MKKYDDKQGFSLAELLIVVAIVSVLVGISVPIFNGKLVQAKRNTDIANIRAAKVAALAEYYLDPTEHKSGITYYYDAHSGTLSEQAAEVVGYNKLYGKYLEKFEAEGICDGVSSGINCANSAVIGVTILDDVNLEDGVNQYVTVSWIQGKKD